MTDLIRIQRQLRKFGLDDDPPLVETDRDGTRLVLDLPLQVRQRDEGGLQFVQQFDPRSQPVVGQAHSQLVFDQDGEIIPGECNFNQEPTP